MDAQKLRRELNQELLDVQTRLRQLRDEMDRLSRTDSRFLQLFTEEHSVLKREVALMNEYKLKENEERDLFFFLSTSLRDSQEKERARVERIKYLQLGLSIACTTLGIISAFLLSYFRNSNIREILNYEREQFAMSNQLINKILNKQDELETIMKKQIEINSKNVPIAISEIKNQMTSEEESNQTPILSGNLNDNSNQNATSPTPIPTTSIITIDLANQIENSDEQLLENSNFLKSSFSKNNLNLNAATAVLTTSSILLGVFLYFFHK